LKGKWVKMATSGEINMASGKVKWFDNKKGFGFIAQDTGNDVFVHHTSIMGGGFKTLNEGEMVSFEVMPSDKGLKAQNVQRAGE
jgi:CspA family cold shock protein